MQTHQQQQHRQQQQQQQQQQRQRVTERRHERLYFWLAALTVSNWRECFWRFWRMDIDDADDNDADDNNSVDKTKPSPWKQVSEKYIFKFLNWLSANLINLLRVTAILTFLTFTIAKFETSKFQICLNETEILQSSFETTKSKTESQESTLQLHKIQVFYH